jgi:Protein kinase domain
MPTKVLCPNPACGKSSTGPDEIVGRNVRCKHCGQQFVARATVDERDSGTHDSPALPRPASTAEVLTAVGRFQVRAKLGAGAFGTVFRAYDPHLDREVALKVPNAGVLDSPKRIERFLREAKAAANLRHPHIVPVYDAGKDGDRYYIASAFIDGQPLAETIEERGTEFKRAARIVRELADAVAYAHGQGVVHRDIKPANVMIDASDSAHLMDFGLAARTANAEKLTNDGAILGTPSYMAPEIAGGQKGDAKPAVDQYALGVVLYELLTGRTPFEGPPASVLYQVLNATPDAPRKIRPYTPLDLQTICLKAMARAPEDRYANCGELADDLRRWLENEPIRARKAGMRERIVRWARREPRLAMSVGAAAAGLLLATVVGIVSAIWLSASAGELRQANRDANAAAALAREKENTANEEAGRARAAELAQQTEATAARAAQKRAEEAEKSATKSAEEAKTEKANAEQKTKDAEEAEKKLKDTVVKLQETIVELRKTQQVVKDKDLGNVFREANTLVEAADYASAETQLDKIPVESRRWEWSLLREFARTKGKPFAEIGLPVEKGSLFSVRYSADLTRAVVAENLRSGNTQLTVWNLETRAKEYETLAPGLTTVQDVQRTFLSKDGSYLVHVIHESRGATYLVIRMYIWDVTTRKPVTPKPVELAFNGRIDNVCLAGAFRPKSSQFALMGIYPKTMTQKAVWIAVVDAANGKVVSGHELPMLTKEPTGFGYMPAGDKLFVSFKKESYAVDLSKKAASLDVEDWKALPDTNRGFLPFPPDNVLAWGDKTVGVWSLKQHRVIKTLADSEKLLWPDLAISSDGQRVAAFTMGANNRVGLGAWDIETGTRTLALTLTKLAAFDETTNPYDRAIQNDKLNVTSGFRDFAMTPDGDRIAYRHNRTLRIIRVPAP